MPDYGLLAGVASGLQSAAQTYQQTKLNSQEQAMKNRQMQLQMMQAGVQQNDDGSLAYRPDIAAKQDYESQQYDPDSEASEKSRGLATGLLKAGGVQHADTLIPEGTSAKDLSGDNSLLGKTLSGVYSMQGRQLSNDRMSDRNDIMRQGLGIRKDNQTMQAANQLDHDPLLTAYQKSSNVLARGQHTLENPPGGVVTTQLLKEVSNDIASGLSAGSANATSDREAQEYKNAATTWAGLMSKVSDAPQGIDSPELVQYMKATLGRLQQGYGQNMKDRAQQLGQDRVYQHNGDATQMIQKKVQQYSNAPGLIGQQSGAPAPIPEDQKQAALQWIAKQPNQNDPQVLAIKQSLGVK